MGVTNVTLESFKNTLKANFDQGLVGECVVELGDQQIYIQGKEQVLFKSYPFFDYTEFISIDWHGKNDVIKLDFREEILENLKNKADLLTNFGFTEHVGNQYMAWKNIHNILKVGGICISELPGMPKFPGHEELPYYTEEFFGYLCRDNGYRILELRMQEHIIPIKGTVCWCVFEKVEDREFISEQLFKKPLENV